MYELLIACKLWPCYIYLPMIVNNLMANVQRTELLTGWKMGGPSGGLWVKQCLWTG